MLDAGGFKLGARGGSGLEQHHLHAAIHIDRAVARGLDRQEDRARPLLGHKRLHTVGNTRARHATKGLDRQRHRRLLVRDVHDQLADFHVTFAATEVVVVKVLGSISDGIHVGQRVAVQPQRVGDALEQTAHGFLCHPQRCQLLLRVYASQALATLILGA